MRIAIVTPYPDSRDSERHVAPVEAYANNLLQNMLNIDHDTVFDVYTYYESAPASYNEKIRDSHGNIFSIQVDRCFRRDATPYLQVLSRLRKSRPDEMHIQHETMMYGGMMGFFLFPLFMAACRLFTISIATLHHIIPLEEIKGCFKESHETVLPRWMIRVAFTIFYKCTGWASSALIVHEDEFKQILITDYGVAPKKIHVIPHGISAPAEADSQSGEQIRREFGIKDDSDVVFGFFGYISKYKGMDYLLDEYAKYVKSHPKSCLLIAGDLHPRLSKNQEYLNYYESLKKKAAGIPKVIWYGALESKQIGHFYKSIDCLILPYQLKIGSSSVLSMAIGSETPFIVSEVLAPTVQNKAVVFGLYENALSKKMSEFTARNLHAESNFQAFVEDLHHKRVWPIAGKKTYDAYIKIRNEHLPKTHLIIGAYGQANLGDELLLQECLNMLGRSNCIVASSDPVSTESIHRVRSVSSHGNPLRLLYVLAKAKYVVAGGGDQLKLLKKSMHAWKYRLMLQLFMLSAAARMLGKKVYLAGIGIGNIDTPFARLLAKGCLRMAHGTTLREIRSYETAKILAPNARIEAASDLCFLGKGNDPLHGRGAATSIGIAPTFEVDHAELYGQIVREIAKAIDREAGDDQRTQFTFLPFQPTHKEHNDVVVSMEILEHVETKGNCSIDAHLSHANASHAYAKLDYIWCVRLHSLLLAVLHGVPFLALVYDDKVRNFLADIGCEEWGIELDENFTAEKVHAKQAELTNRKQEITTKILQARARLQTKAWQNERLFSLFSGHSPQTDLHNHSPILA